MAPDERERNFDKALGRHLRSAAAADKAASSPGGASSPLGSCPDAETLAAYHERSLLPEQLNSLKEHLVGCGNCQAVLAHLETTEEIPLQAAQEKQVLAETATTSILPAAGPTHAPSPDAVAGKARRLRLLRGARWQWLAPAGAIAAGLLLWVALHEHQPLHPTLSEKRNTVAENRVPPAPIPSVSTSVPQSSESSKAAGAPALQKPAPREYAPSLGSGMSQAPKQSHDLRDAARLPSAMPLGDKELRARKDEKEKTATDQLAPANPADLDAKNLPLTARQTVEVQSSSQVVAIEPETAPSQKAPAQNQYNNAQQQVPGPSPLNRAEASKKAKGETTAAPAPSPAPPPPMPAADGGAAASYSTSESVVVTGMISSPRLISAPGSSLVWRVGRTGLIEFSKDGGSSWSRQTSGVLADLQTGSAPSDQVCWIVGRVGAILLTTDAGAHWKIVPSPLAEDLGGVRATDAFHATIWNAPGTKSFETRDGGLIWKPVRHP